MLSLFYRSPVVKVKSLFFRITLIVLSVISAIAIFSPVVAFALKHSSPLSEMPESVWYYAFRCLFGMSIIIGAIIFAIYKKTSVIAIPAVLGFITSLFPLMQKINVYTDYKAFIEKFNMTADYTNYLINIGIYLLFALLCIITFLYVSGLLPYSIIVFVMSALTLTAVIFITIDRSKNLEYEIFNIFDILCFAYTAIAALMPATIAISTTRVNNSDLNRKQTRYQPKRMRT